MLLRKAISPATWAPDARLQDLLEREFTDRLGNPDLSPSVYEVESETDAVRILAEHCAGAGLRPDRGVFLLVEGDDPPATATPGENAYFSQAVSAHREIPLRSKTALKRFSKHLKGSARRIAVSKDQVREYVRDRIAAADPEWLRFVEEHERGALWRKFAFQGAKE